MTRHAVSIYEHEGALIGAVTDFVGPALADGSPVLLIATSRHLQEVSSSLVLAGIDLADVVDRGLLRTADAASLLGRFLRDGRPDPGLFDHVVGGLVRELSNRGPLSAFGEMVALLWDEGNVVAALELEGLWNGLLSDTGFSLLCGYPQRLLDAEGEAKVCAHHDDRLPPVLVESRTPGRVTRRFEPAPSGAHAARSFVSGTMLAWDCPHLLDAAKVIVSELAGNALRYSTGRFTVTLEQRRGEIWIGVHDSAQQLPQRRRAAVSATGGRGLELVAALSSRWGTDPDETGKTVWAVLSR